MEFKMKPKPFVILSAVIAAIIFVPYMGAYVYHVYQRRGFPEDYFKFPPEKVEKVSYHPTVFLIAAIVVGLIIVFYLFPTLFGFKKPNLPKERWPKMGKLPIWFWIGLGSWGITLALLIAKIQEPRWFLNWSFVPLCWGFIFVLDGIVYSLNNNKSMFSDHPTELFGMGIVSISGWLIFEYLNLFIEHNWYFPAADLIRHDNFLVYAVVGSSAFLPMSFEWYQLLKKLPVLRLKYKNGPRIVGPKWLQIAVFALAMAGLFFAPFFPNNLFWLIWLAPVVILAIALDFVGIGTPFTDIAKKGNWTALMVFALTFLFQGFLLEWWNYLSGAYLSDGNLKTYNAAYWGYCIPFVSRYHVFEMPLLGFSGYLLFSVHCWLWWIAFSRLMNISTIFSLGNDFDKNDVR